MQNDVSCRLAEDQQLVMRKFLDRSPEILGTENLVETYLSDSMMVPSRRVQSDPDSVSFISFRKICIVAFHNALN